MIRRFERWGGCDGTPGRSPWPRVAVLVACAAVGAACGGEPGAFSPAAGHASTVLWLFWAMLAAAGLVFLVVLTTLARAISAGASRRRTNPPDATDTANAVEPADATDPAAERRARRLVIGGGVLLPALVLVPLAVATLATASALSHRVGPPALRIEVVGHQYWWEITYVDHAVVTANEIRVPVDEPIELLLRSEDVIHSVWVPQLSGKIDMIPGEQTELRFEADRIGEFLGYCAEFCGLQHARMRMHVIVEPRAEFDRWLAHHASPAASPTDDDARAGAAVFLSAGCGACHTVRGTEAQGSLGPDLTHLADRRYLAAGTLRNERGQLAGWVANAQADKPGALMPPSALSPEELLAVVAYLETLT